jgi:hypothetical protein
LFLLRQGRDILIVQVYVDDIVFGGSSNSLVARFADDMGREFEMSMMGELGFFFLGHGVECVSIDIHSFVSCNSEQWPRCYIRYLVGNYNIIATCLDMISEPPAETLHVHLCKPSPTMVRVVFTQLSFVLISKRCM